MKQANKQKRLTSRIEDWARCMSDRHQSPSQSGVQKRVETGGYHKPGSNNK